MFCALLTSRYQVSVYRTNGPLVYIYEPRREKTNVLVSDLVQHKPGCTATEDGQRLEISDLESRGIELSM